MQRFIHNINRTITDHPIPKISLHRIQLYSTSVSSPPSTPAAAEEDSFANYLVNSLGFSLQKAQSASKLVSKYQTVNDFNFYSNAISVVGFLKSRGFDDNNIKRILYSDARLLCSNVDGTVRPKLQFLQDQGFSEADIIGVVSANPGLLVSGVESSIVPAFEVLRKLMGCDTDVIALLKRSRAFHFSSIKYLMPNVALLTSYGIPIELIRKHLISGPNEFMRKPEMFNDMVSKVKNKWEMCPNSPMFLSGIRLACGLSEENIESKCQMFKRFGWTQSDIQTLVMKYPTCFGCSVATIEKKLNFLMKELKLEPGYLILNFVLFGYSLEKRIVPRHKILLILKEKGLLEKNPSLSSAICMLESRFLNKFVLPFNEIHEV